MLASLALNLMLSALVATQPHGSPGNDTQLSFMTPRADGPAPSCGLLIDDDRVGNIMQKNGQCNSIAKKATSLNLNIGCVCALFGEAGCDKDKRKSWRWISGVPHKDYDLTHHKDIKWYQCFTEQKEAQDWVNRFADYLSQPRPTIGVKDGQLVWEQLD